MKIQLQDWSWRRDDEGQEFVKCQHWPSQIHLELISAGIIKDPFYGINEIDCQWVAKERWQYRTEFEVSSSKEDLVLCFEGLDTFATISINDEIIAHTENMFRRYEFLVNDHITSGTNTLLVTFEAALSRGQELFKSHKQGAISNGDPSRLYVRKAAYHYGWDW